MKELEKFSLIKAEITTFVAPILSVKVTDFPSSQKAIESAKIMKEMAKRLDNMRREEVDPLNDKVKQINTHAKQVGAALEHADLHIRNELNRFALEQEKIRQEEIRKANIERLLAEESLRLKQEEELRILENGAELFGDSLSTESVKVKHEQEQAVQRMEMQQKTFDINEQQIKNTRKTLCVSVTNLNEVPKEFLIIELNESMAKAAYKGGMTTIPGLRFYEEVSVSISSKTRAPRAALQ